MSGKCPLQGFTCDVCAYTGNCAPSRTEENTKQIIALLQQVLSEIRRR